MRHGVSASTSEADRVHSTGAILDDMSFADGRASLVARVRARELTVVPGVFDLVSARIADQAGFPALYMSGYGVSASRMGLPDAGLTSFADMVDQARRLASGTATPLIADADTGFGGLLNVRHTVEGYEAVGVAAIQLEDQEFPKKCGHAAGRRVIDAADMVKKIEVAVESRTSDDFLIIARTDARSSLGLDEAIARGRAYAAAGADLVFVESPETDDEFARIAATVDAPLVANMVEGGFSPVLPAHRLAELGYTIALFPTMGLFAATSAMRSAYDTLRRDGVSPGAESLIPIGEMHTLMGFDDVWAFDERWSD